MFAEASAIRSAADLRFDINDDLPTLGCFWSVVWDEQRAYVYMGDDSDTEEFYPWGRFGGFSWDENISRDEAIIRLASAVNLLHLGDVPIEMAGKRPDTYFMGNVGSVGCPAQRSQQFPVRRWLMDTGCGHDLIRHREVLAQNSSMREADKAMTSCTANGR